MYETWWEEWHENIPAIVRLSLNDCVLIISITVVKVMTFSCTSVQWTLRLSNMCNCNNFILKLFNSQQKRWVQLFYTVTLRYNAVAGRHLLRPPYKWGALWDPVDLFDIIIPRQSKGQGHRPLPPSSPKAWSWTWINHSFRNIQSPCSRG